MHKSAFFSARLGGRKIEASKSRKVVLTRDASLSCREIALSLSLLQDSFSLASLLSPLFRVHSYTVLITPPLLTHASHALIFVILSSCESYVKVAYKKTVYFYNIIIQYFIYI